MYPQLKLKLLLLLLAAPLTLLGQSQTAADARKDLDTCHIHEVKTLPGSHHFGSDFIEATAGDPKNRNAVYALTADLSTKVPPSDRAMYISKSTDGGKIWTQVARVDSQYF